MFSATLALTDPAADLRPGLTGRVTISGAPQVGVLHVPRGAVFDRDGGTVVFVRGGSGGGTVGGFTPTPVKVLGRTEASAVVEGVAEGAAIALADPSRRGAASSSPAASGPAMPAAAPAGGRR
jgi:multidrug efflux pump subunit AcrA (membrane-fusion protein)